MRRAWLAPVRRLPAEILSDIFIFCRDLDHFSPLIISNVNRMWRRVVLTTPRAWSMIYLDSARSHKHMLKYVSTYVERSDPYFLHIFLPRYGTDIYSDGTNERIGRSLERIILSHSNRLKCIFTFSEQLKMFNHKGFQNLTRLLLDGAMKVKISFFDSSRFPQLRVLVLSGEVNIATDPNTPIDIAFPRLQHLAVNDCDHDSSWITLVEHCSATLKGLSVFDLYEHTDFSQITIHFPILEYLMLRPYPDESPQTWPINAITPSLLYYAEMMDDIVTPFIGHTDLKAVTHLRMRAVPRLEGYPSLRTLQIRFDWSSYASDSTFVAQLERNDDVSPALSHIEVYIPEYQYPPGSLALTSVRSWIEIQFKEARPHATISFPNRMTPLPGSLEDIMCGFSMPCGAFWMNVI